VENAEDEEEGAEEGERIIDDDEVAGDHEVLALGLCVVCCLF